MKSSGTFVRALALIAVNALVGCGDDGINHLPDGPPSNPTDAPPAAKPAVLKLSQDSADFGSVVTGDSSPEVKITVANIGEGPSGPISAAISGAQGSNYHVTTDCTTLAVAATCTLSVKFAPNDVGTKAANVEVTATPGGTLLASLSGLGIAPGQLRITPSSNQFDTTTVGATSSNVTFTVTNTGQTSSGALSTVTGGSDVGQFTRVSDTCNGQSLAAGAMCTVVAAFKPTASGPKFASFAVSGSPGGTVTAAVNGLAVSDAQLFLNPTSQSFGTVVTGSVSQDVVFNLVNIGGVTSGAITQSLNGTGAASYAVVTSSCANATLAPGASCQVTVHFAPSATGAAGASLSFIGAPGGTQAATLTGTGAAPGAISIAPSVKQFGNIAVGQLSATQDFTVTNTGGSPTGALAANLLGADASSFFITANNCQGQSLVGNGTCTITARFQPSTAGTHGATLSVTGAPGGTTTASLSGNGIPPAALSLTPNAHDFGSVAVGDVTGVQTFTVQNVGGSTTGVPMATLSGPNANQFTLTSSCGAALAPIATCTLSVRFAPTAIGLDSANLNVTASPGSTATATLFGQGITAAALSVSPSSIGFGLVAVGDTSYQDGSFILTNNGQSTTGPIALTITGANASSFAITTQNCGALAAGQSCVVHVQFAPIEKGDLTAKVQIAATPGGTLGVALSGEGRPRLEIIGRYVGEGGLIDVDPTYNFGDQTVFTQQPYNNGLYLLLRNNTQSSEFLEVQGTDLSSFDFENDGADFVETYNSCDFFCEGFGCGGGDDFAGKKHDPKHEAYVAKNRAKLAKLPASVRTAISARATSKHAAQTKTSSIGFGGDIGGNGGTCEVDFVFIPQSTGPKTGSIQFSIGPTVYDQANEALRGNGVDSLYWSLSYEGPAITSFNFGNVAKNQSSAQQVLYLSTRFDAPETNPISVAPITQGTFDIDATSCNGDYLTGGSACPVYTTFHPTTLGPANELVQATTSPAGVGTGGAPLIELDGTGVDPNLLIINPVPVAFGSALRGTQPIINVVVKNLAGSPDSGPLTYGIESDSCASGVGSGSGSGSGSGFDGGACFQILNDDSPGDCGYNVPVGNGTQCNIRVQFVTGNGPAPSSPTATLAIDASPGIVGGEKLVAVTGTISSTLVASPPSPMNFGTVNVGASPSKSFTITNQSTAAVTIGTRAGGPVVPVTAIHITNDGCQNTTLAAGASCSVTVQFTPSNSATSQTIYTWNALDRSGQVAYTVNGTGHVNQASIVVH